MGGSVFLSRAGSAFKRVCQHRRPLPPNALHASSSCPFVLVCPCVFRFHAFVLVCVKCMESLRARAHCDCASSSAHSELGTFGIAS